MNFDTLLSIFSFAIALGGLAPLLVKDERRKLTILTTIIVALVICTGTALYRHQQAEIEISKVQHEITEQLTSGPLTFDQIFIGLHFRPFPIVSEALFRSVEKGNVKHQLSEFNKDGRLVPVRTYYIELKK